MVNNPRKLTRKQPPDPLPADRKIPGPLYDLVIVKEIVTAETVHQANESVEDDLLDLEWDNDDVVQIIRALDAKKDYRKSEWCIASNNRIVDADVYVIPYDHIECRRSERHMDYYIKFGFRSNQVMLMLISCHESREKD